MECVHEFSNNGKPGKPKSKRSVMAPVRENAFHILTQRRSLDDDEYDSFRILDVIESEILLGSSTQVACFRQFKNINNLLKLLYHCIQSFLSTGALAGVVHDIVGNE